MCQGCVSRLEGWENRGCDLGTADSHTDPLTFHYQFMFISLPFRSFSVISVDIRKGSKPFDKDLSEPVWDYRNTSPVVMIRGSDTVYFVAARNCSVNTVLVSLCLERPWRQFIITNSWNMIDSIIRSSPSWIHLLLLSVLLLILLTTYILSFYKTALWLSNVIGTVTSGRPLKSIKKVETFAVSRFPSFKAEINQASTHSFASCYNIVSLWDDRIGLTLRCLRNLYRWKAKWALELKVEDWMSSRFEGGILNEL